MNAGIKLEGKARRRQPDIETPIRVDWRVRREGGGFKVVDVLVEGISMLFTHRGGFASVIQNAGGRLEGLLAALRKRTAAN